MAAISAGKDARPVAGSAVYYERHRPEQTLLYQIVEEYYPAFLNLLAAQGRALPPAVQREFEEYLRCGRLEHGFLRVRCEHCHAERLVAFSWPLLRIPAPAAFVIPFTSQAARLLPELWRAAYDRRLHGCRRYESKDGRGRAKQEARAGSNAGSSCREDPAVIEKILTHLNKEAAGAEPARLPESRAPPQAVLFD